MNSTSKNRPKLLLVVDDDLKYGVEMGYYPSLRKKIEEQDLDVISKNDNNTVEYKINGNLRSGEFYILNPYNNRYTIFDSNDTYAIDLSKAKTAALKQALKMMGAKHVKIEKFVSEEKATEIDSKVKGQKGGVEVETYGNYLKRDATEQIFSIEFTANPDEIKPYSAEEVEMYMIEHDLLNEMDLRNHLNDLENNKLYGRTTINVSFFEEIDRAIEIGVGLDMAMIGGKIDFKKKSEKKHRTSCTLTVEF